MDAAGYVQVAEVGKGHMVSAAGLQGAGIPCGVAVVAATVVDMLLFNTVALKAALGREGVEGVLQWEEEFRQRLARNGPQQHL